MAYSLPVGTPPVAMRALLLVTFLVFVSAAHGQSIPSWAEPSRPSVDAPPAPNVMPLEELSVDPGSPPTPTVVPIDGGLGLLALAGGALAAARLRRRAD